MPWNFPIALPLRTIVPALLAGNTVVLKPSEVTSRSGTLIAELFSGLLPEGVLNIVQGGASVGAALCEADVDLVVFTGSVSSGRQVARACAERLVPSVLELGGKDAAIVLGNADIERAANGIVWAAMMNAGQNCASVERVYVERSVSQAFIKAVCEAVASLKPDVDFGPVATEKQRETVERHVRDALARGGELLLGGAMGKTAFRVYPPTVIRIPNDDSELMKEETFGPVLPIGVVDTEVEAVNRVNASRFGLTASVWTRDVKRGLRIAHQLRAGVVTVNNHGFTGALAAAPWSGLGDTGWGITNSPLALDAMTRPRFVLVDRNRRRRELWWFPYTPALQTLALAMTVLRSSKRSIGARLRALAVFLRAVLVRIREL
jgi:acyl-CoA reductase-like NAD-dependent aldehyde dehydrogenase